MKVNKIQKVKVSLTDETHVLFLNELQFKFLYAILEDYINSGKGSVLRRNYVERLVMLMSNENVNPINVPV